MINAMKAAWLATGLLAAVCGATHAQAKAVTVKFSIPVASLWVEDYEWGAVNAGYVQSYTIAGITVSTADTLNGSLIYDDAAPLENGVAYNAQFTMSFPGGRTFKLTDAELQVRQGSGSTGDAFSASGIASESDVTVAMGIGFVAPAGQLAPDSLPAADDWQYFTGGQDGTFFALTVKNPASTDPAAFQALYIDEGSFTPYAVSAVPEPGTAGMLLAGLALVGAAARRRRIALTA